MGVINNQGQPIIISSRPIVIHRGKRRRQSLLSSDEKTARVTVTDNGGGIPENQIDYIFEPFFSTKKNAIGLGLVYAKQVIDAHHGDTESKEGVGTTVTIKIPRAQSTD
ncbi:hypothetical protein IH574_02595 [Candidatus Bathyarchaeota archaeon]|nr:hypothetical protein [Candidatus Bathyarchaeota archaeon]